MVHVVDIIPRADSADSGQHSEPSIGVDPFNPMQLMAGSFGASTNPYFASTDGGTTWSEFGMGLTLSDKSIAWTSDGSAVLTATLALNYGPITTYSAIPGVDTDFSQINQYVGPDDNDQPWIRTGPSNQVYVAYNNLGACGPNAGGSQSGTGMTASVLVNNQSVTLDRVGTTYQDDPAVRLAVNGNTVYGVFDRWTSSVEQDANGDRYNSQLVVVRSDNGGMDNFTALGNGVIASPTNHIGVYVDASNTALTLGQERIAGGDIAIAVDPNHPNRVIVAYTNAPSVGVVQLVVTESTDAGLNWAQKFTTSSGVRSGQPGLAILANGAVGLLYDQYLPTNGSASVGTLSQNMLTTTDDFGTTSTTVLGSESNSTPTSQFPPYLGDFFDLTAVGNTFYGIFSASNEDDGTNAQFADVSFQRRFKGTKGTADFELTDENGNSVPFTIDPYFFSDPLQSVSAWNSAVGGDFAGAANWSLGAVPAVGNDVVIGASGVYTVTSSANETVDSLTTIAGATLSVTGGTFTINNGTGLGENAGTIKVGAGANLVFNGSIVNSGLIEAFGGTIATHGAVSGTGSFEVGNGGSVNAIGNNYVFHGAGGSELMQGTGNLNQAFGDSGSAQLYFAGNQNQLFGGSANDWLGVSGTNNALVGGAGNDFIGATGNSNTLSGGSGNPTLSANGNLNALFAGSGQDWLGTSGNQNQIFGGPGADWLGATGINNAVSAGTGNSTLFANGSSNTLSGSGGGNDWIGVSGNNNTLYGGAGNNYIAATGNSNTLDPNGAGTDVLFAAANAHDHDTFVYHPGYGSVTINNFVPQVGDVINIAGFGITNVQGFAPYVSTSADGSIMLNLGGSSHLTLEGIPGGLQNSWFNFHA
jgi:hypothetical protein